MNRRSFLKLIPTAVMASLLPAWLIKNINGVSVNSGNPTMWRLDNLGFCIEYPVEMHAHESYYLNVNLDKDTKESVSAHIYCPTTGMETPIKARKL